FPGLVLSARRLACCPGSYRVSARPKRAVARTIGEVGCRIPDCLQLVDEPAVSSERGAVAGGVGRDRGFPAVGAEGGFSNKPTRGGGGEISGVNACVRRYCVVGIAHIVRG